MKDLYCTVVQLARVSANGRTKFVRVAFLGLAIAVVGCTKKDPAEERLRQRAAELASAKAQAIAAMSATMEAAPAETDLDSVAPAGDLQGEIDQFTDLAGCVKRHRMNDPLLADGIEALGYDRFVADSCRSIEAMKTRDPKKCDDAISTPMKLHCLADYAMLTGDESRCPISARMANAPEHDVKCLAAARRDVRPCAALAGMARATCEGLVAHDESRCGTDARCARLLGRWKNALPRTLGRTPYASTATLDIGTADASADGGEAMETHSLAKEAAAGVLLLIDGKTTRVSFGDTRGFWVRMDDVDAGFLVDLPNTDPGEKKLTHGAVRIGIRYPNSLVQEATPVAPATVRVTEIATEVNGPVKLEVEASVGPSGATHRAVFHVDSWLRDRMVTNDAAKKPDKK